MEAKVERVWVGALALLAILGMLGAFWGLTSSSLWFDELYTAWVVGTDGSLSGAMSRMSHDVHPPIFHLLMPSVAALFGNSEFVLRFTVALIGCLSIAGFILLLRRHYSLQARLFAAVLAISSPFWFVQSQNVRSYTLAFLIGVILLSVSLNLIDDSKADRNPSARSHISLAIIGLIATLTHFYLMFEVLVVCGALFILLPKSRVHLCCIALLCLAVGYAYLKFVIEPYTSFSTSAGWIPNTLSHYVTQTKLGVSQVFSRPGLIAIALCAILAVYALLQSKAPKSLQEIFDIPLAFCAAVVVGLWLAGFSSSQVLAPNFTDRNWLVSAPFFWGACARLYDLSIPRVSGKIRLVAIMALLALVVMSSLKLNARGRQINEPYRGLSDIVTSYPGCRGKTITLVYFSRRGFKDVGFAKKLHDQSLQYYLKDFAKADAVFVDDLEGKFRAQGTAMGGTDQSCPVMAAAVHGSSPQGAEEIERAWQNAGNIGKARLDMEPLMASSIGSFRDSSWVAGYVFRRHPS